MQKKVLIIISVSVAVFIAAPNAQAYFLELPRIFKDALVNKPANSKVAQYAESVPVAQPTPSTTGSAPTPMMETQPMMVPAQPPSKTFSQPAPQSAPMMESIPMKSGNQEFNNERSRPRQSGPSDSEMGSPTPTCNINGVEVPGRCEDLEKMGQQGPMISEEETERRQKEQEQRQLQDMKRGAQQTQMGIRNFEFMLKQLIKQGIAIPQEIQDKMAKVKNLLEATKSAQTAEELQGLGLEEMGEIMQDLNEFRQEYAEKELRMRDMKRGLRGMEQGLKMFERQLAQLERQKVAIPSGIKETLDKVKTILAAVRAAQTWKEMEAAGIEDLQDLMQTLDENRQSLEMLARWPRTLKDMDRELKRLTNELKRSKIIVNRLLKKEIDLSSVYAEFEAAVNKLKSVRDDAVAKMQAGEGEEAFELVQNDFFGQMDDVWQNQRIIMTMSNLGRFASEFKRGIADAQRMIRQLKRQKIDTSELEALLEQAKVKGEEILALVKTSPIDEEVIMAGLQEMENLRQEFENKAAELTGQEESMPWEQGPKMFKTQPRLPDNWEKLAPKKKEVAPQEEQQPQPQPTTETAPAPIAP